MNYFSYTISKYINGSNNISVEYSRILEILTGRDDIRYLNLSVWGEIFQENIIDNYRKWCPVCLEEWYSKSMTIYEPLIWGIKEVNKCDLHNILLESNCSNCKRKLPFMNSRLQAGYCQHCFSFLGGRGKSQLHLSDYNSYIGNFKLLIEKTSTLPFKPSKNLVSNSIKILLRDFNSTKDFAEFLGVKRRTLTDWITNRHFPSFNSLMLIIRKLKITIFDLIFLGNIGDKECEGKVLTRDILIKALNSNLSRSLSEISEVEGISLSSAKYYFPELCQMISNRKKKTVDY